MFNNKQSLLLLLVVSATSALAHMPIVLVHGILSDDYGMAPTEIYIRKHMGEDVYIKNVQLGLGEVSSLTSIYHQAEYLRDAIVNDPLLKDGFNIIAHSQGGLVARYYLQKHNSPQVHTYISWGSPQQGVFGLPGTYDERMIWLDILEVYAYKFIYAKPLQKYIGAASYWHDTLHWEKYIAKSAFLPFLNNEKEHPDAELFKRNVCNVKNMVLVKSTNEDIVEPSASCHFEFYKKGSKSEIEKLEESEEYKNDVLGLKTLNESGRLHLLLADCTHSNFQEDEKNFVENTLPFLVADSGNAPEKEATTAAAA
jgi:palmitoyl-protein thioesterase